MDSDKVKGNGSKSAFDEDIINVADFNERIVGAYNTGTAERGLSADTFTARSFIPAGTCELRDFSYIAPDIPEFMSQNCVACMDCVTECPDTAILGKVVETDVLEMELAKVKNEGERQHLHNQFAKTSKYWTNFEKKGQKPGYFGIFIDPTKCKGCNECVTVCGDRNALKMIKKTEQNLSEYRRDFSFFRKLPETPKHFIIEKSLQDMMLADRSILYVGGAGSCMGCGEATAIRMMLAATGFIYGSDSIAIVASTGCNSVFGSTYPYNPYLVPWTNSLFENSAVVAMGVRMMWDKYGWEKKRLWVMGGDGAMIDIGFQALSRMMASGADIKVLVLENLISVGLAKQQVACR